MEAEVRVVLTGHARGEVLINGEKIPGVRKLAISAALDQTNTVNLEITAKSVEFVGVADVTTIESTERECVRGNGS